MHFWMRRFVKQTLKDIKIVNSYLWWKNCITCAGYLTLKDEMTYDETITLFHIRECIPTPLYSPSCLRIQNGQWIMHIFTNHSIVIHAGQAAANLTFKYKLLSKPMKCDLTITLSLSFRKSEFIQPSTLETPAYSKSETVEFN